MEQRAYFSLASWSRERQIRRQHVEVDSHEDGALEPIGNENADAEAAEELTLLFPPLSDAA